MIPVLPITYGLGAVMVAIHAGGAYLGLRGEAIPRTPGTYISIYEALYYAAMMLLLAGSPLMAPLALFAVIHWAGAFAYYRGYLGRLSTPRRLKLYGAYELVELGFIFIIMASLS
ncbi:hypothetical protein GCM10007981_10680 [Thermocladium modestius]|uniref:DUF4345 domain-containing protein n=1 Tax=Thermocladium modestius TaxID=62609 RepID=A0A830GVV8_9CREN|nr:hypothetical protein [Thermocladium modestius]GGP20868.1 hypothetical protein GCM10007981_10680 [Thermocladium modestius]